MSDYNNEYYTNSKGLKAPVDQDHPDNPFSGNIVLANQALGSKMSTIQREGSDGRTTAVHFRTGTMASLDKKLGLLIVAVHYSDPQYRCN